VLQNDNYLVVELLGRLSTFGSPGGVTVMLITSKRC